MPWICCVSSSIPGGANISICACGADTSISTSLSSSSPSRSFLRNFCRVAESSSPAALAGCSAPSAPTGPVRRAGGSRTSSTRSSAESSALRRRFASVLDRDFDEVADDRIDVAADIADLGELRRFDLDERRIREPREAPRDLGLSDARRSDHEDVLGRDLLPQGLGHLLASPAVSEGDRHGALCPSLADDVLVQLVDDFLGSHGRHGGGRPGARMSGNSTRPRTLAALVQRFDDDLLIGVDAQVGGDRKRLANDGLRVELGIFKERTRSRLRVRAPEPIAINPSSGSMTSPVPVMISEDSRSATASIASKRRNIRSVRQSLASSTAERRRFPWCLSSFASKRSNSVNASAVPPAKPARIRS